MSVPWFVPIVFGLFILLAFAAKYRFVMGGRNRIKKLANAHGLAFLNWELPGDFPTNFLDGIRSWDKAHDVIAGMEGDTMLLAFDIEVGFGKQRRDETVVAVRSHNFQALSGHTVESLNVGEDGAWRISIGGSWFRGRRKLLSPAQIESVWKSIA